MRAYTAPDTGVMILMLPFSAGTAAVAFIPTVLTRCYCLFSLLNPSLHFSLYWGLPGSNLPEIHLQLEGTEALRVD